MQVLAFHRQLLAVAALAAAGASAQASVASDILLNFDAVASGTHANLAIGSASSLIHFDNATRTQDLDANGDPIVNQFHWEADTDPSLPAVTVDNPANFGRNAAPSGINALNTAFGPVLMQLSTPLTLSSFSFTLENSSFGQPVAEVLFLNNTGHVVQSLSFQQNLAGATVHTTAFTSDISAIVLPSGKFVDDVHLVSSVPEPTGLALAVLGLAALGLAAPRRST